MSGRSTLRLLGLVALAAACGGRAIQDGAGGSGAAGASNSTGSANGGSGARAGAGGSATVGAAGGVSASGGVSAGGVSAAGAAAASGECGSCPDIDCAPGSSPRQLPGWCCPKCLNEDCAVGRAKYEEFRLQLIDKYSSVGCMLDSDCTYWYESNQCAVRCGFPIPSSTLDNLQSNLESFAAQTCDPECMPPFPLCPPPPLATCVQGRCQ